MTDRRPGRLWRYRYGSWSPSWWNWIWPYPGGDEYGRRTLVFHVPFVGFVAVAYWTCKCQDCDEAREQTAEWEREEMEARDGN